MRTGFLVPIGNNAFALAIVVALAFTAIWLIYHAIMHSNKNQIESRFNNRSSPSDRLRISDANDVGELLLKFSNRVINVDAGTKVFWSSEIPLSLAIAQADPQSPLKIYIRINSSARDLGHKISIGKENGDSIGLQLTSESLIFSDDESSFYPIDVEKFQKLRNVLRNQRATINNKIQITEIDSISLFKSIEKILQIQASNPKILLLGE
jgi:hypothetical protein